MLLDRILEAKRAAVERKKSRIPLREIMARAQARQAPGIAAAASEKFIIIGETKKASPSAGIIVPYYRADIIARSYQRAGASAVSVLTEEKFFLGSMRDLAKVKSSVSIPVLAKDFVIDPYQVYEARAYGADALLLIRRILDLPLFRELFSLACNLGMDVLMEAHTLEECESILETAGTNPHAILGINNRDLDTLEIHIETTFHLRRLLKQVKIPIISESGIKDADTLAKLHDAGINGALVGEYLLRSLPNRNAIFEFLQKING
jgi:indole-3-glycerol phosphate synthase